MKSTIYDLDFEKLQAWLVEKGEKPYRAKQIFHWLYQKHVDRFEAMTDLKKELIDCLSTHFYINPLRILTQQISRDGTRKILFELQDGQAIETVLMRLDYGNSVCVTSQVGCNMGCTFCASGLIKKQRDLSTGEMVAQVMAVQGLLGEERVSHVVVMGIGEPFDNYDSVMSFLRSINHNLGLAIGARHITVSTCGIVPKIYQFSDEKVQFNLAISLHAPNDALRSKLMPINQAYPLVELMKAMRYYSEKNNRKITFEYILLKGVNDQLEHAHQLADLIRGLHAYVNLIPYNPVSESFYQAVDLNSALVFYDALKKRGVTCTLRQEHGRDIDAACGQLRAKSEGVLS
jgi:23S rRNA (adenine2503-C2)-methyltransferase